MQSHGITPDEAHPRQAPKANPGEFTITVSILTYCRPEMVQRGLQYLCDMHLPDIQILVVDNSENSLTEEIVKGSFPGVVYIRCHTNTGVAGRNLGVRMACTPIVVTLDDDVTDLNAEGIAVIKKAFLEHPDLGALNFRVLNSWNGEVSNWCHHRRPEIDADKSFLTYEISEGAVAFRKSAFEATEGYPSRFFIGQEGKDLAYQLMNRGFKVMYDGTISVRHHHHPSGRPNWRRYYFDTRNQIWLAARHMPLSYAARFLLIGLLSMCLYSLRDGFFLKWMSGVRDGILGLREVLGEREVWSQETRRLCEEIDANRPSTWYMIRKRLFRKGVSI